MRATKMNKAISKRTTGSGIDGYSGMVADGGDGPRGGSRHHGPTFFLTAQTGFLNQPDGQGGLLLGIRL